MLIIHILLKCLNCNEELEAFDDDMKSRQVDCPLCGYSNELDDIRVITYEREW